MNAISPFVATERTLVWTKENSVRRPDPATLAVVGCAAAVMLAAAALMAAMGEAETVGPALGGNVAVILFAAMNANRPYRRCWAPALILLGLVGATGIALALLPAAEHFVTPSAITRFGIESLHYIAQLGAMGMAAFAWSTAGRSASRAKWSIAALASLMNLQLGEVIGRALAGSTSGAWTFAIELLFASWLLATTLGLTRRARAVSIATDRFGKPIGRLPQEPVEVFREIGQHGDRLR